MYRTMAAERKEERMAMMIDGGLRHSMQVTMRRTLYRIQMRKLLVDNTMAILRKVSKPAMVKTGNKVLIEA